jgi:hypothetical protein
VFPTLRNPGPYQESRETARLVKDLSPCWEEVLSSIPAGPPGRNVMAASASLDSAVDVKDLYL